MVYFEKSQPAPQSLAKEKLKKSGSYKEADVVEQLRIDFCNKCYICEQRSTSFNVEHFVPHRGDVDLKFDWNNLFLACNHCNSVKGDRYTDILNCTKRDDCVDRNIAYKFSPFPKERASFEALSQDQRTQNTVRLLSEVFGGKTVLQQLNSDNLNNCLLDEMIVFQENLRNYYKNDEKESFLIQIKMHLNKTSQFTAFKRYIIRSNDGLRRDFEQYIID